MLTFYIVAVLATSVLSLNIPCKKEDKINNYEFINDPAEWVGNWSYVYHWDNLNDGSDSKSAESSAEGQKCLQVEIKPLTLDLAKKELDKCGDKDFPFKLEDAKLKLDAFWMGKGEGIVFMGAKEAWLLAGCDTFVRMDARKLKNDAIITITYKAGIVDIRGIELLSKNPLQGNELYCLALNIPVDEDMFGMEMC